MMTSRNCSLFFKYSQLPADPSIIPSHLPIRTYDPVAWNVWIIIGT